MIRDVTRQRTPKWRASQVTSSSLPMRPDVTPETARSREAVMDSRWRSMLRDRSKHTPTGAAMSVTRRSRPTDHFMGHAGCLQLECCGLVRRRENSTFAQIACFEDRTLPGDPTDHSGLLPSGSSACLVRVLLSAPRLA